MDIRKSRSRVGFFECVNCFFFYSTEATASLVLQQLKYMWSKKLIACLFGKVLSSVDNAKKKKSTADTEALPLELVQSNCFDYSRVLKGI